MTIAEAERFYEQDTKKYEVEKNKEFLKWLKDSINGGYNSFIEINELQELINNIVNWYEIKYPEREMEFYEGIRHFDFENMYTLSKVMDTKQLMYRLPRNQLNLIECGYRAKGWGQYPIYENDFSSILKYKLLTETKETLTEYRPEGHLPWACPPGCLRNW